ncbi:MAG: hypothetical protein WCT27_02640 [Patescibacteria group bacterium]|jgi:hypothetical protein
MDQPTNNSSKITAVIVLVVTVIIIVVGGFVFKNSISSSNKNTNTSTAPQKIVYAVRKVTAATENGATAYTTTVFKSAIDGSNKQQIYQTPMNATIQALANGSFAVFDASLDVNNIKQISSSGTVEKTYSFPETVREFVMSPSGTIYAYGSFDIKTTTDGGPLSSIETLAVVMGDGTQKTFSAADFVPNARKDFNQVVPLSFSNDNSTLYVEVWPTARGGDYSDPHGYYAITIGTWNIDPLAFSGSKNLDFTLSESSPAIFNFDILPTSKQAIISKARDIAIPMGFDLLNFQSHVSVPLFSIGTDGLYPNLSYLSNRISPNEQEIILTNSSNKTILIYNLQSKKLGNEIKIDGDPQTWLSNNEIVYQVWHKKSWDDQQYSLKVFNLTTKQSTDVYTQTTDHVEGAGMSKIGDAYYQYVGPIE